MKILFAGGGTIGHIAPSVAVLRAAEKIDADVHAHFLCNNTEEERRFLDREGLRFTAIPRVRGGWRGLLALPRALRAARAVLMEEKPDVVFCKGGATALAVARVAHRLQIPVVLHESDVVPGRANRTVSAWAAAVCTGFPPSHNSVRWKAPPERVIYTGNPVRPDIAHGSIEKARQLTGLLSKKPVLLVYGGSQGAEALNTAVRLQLDRILELCDVIHLTGRGKEGEKVEKPGYYYRAFAHDDLPHFYALATMAVSRAGAGSISELAACSLPTIFVPLPGLAQDHQTANATVAQQTGGCMVLAQKDVRGKIVPAIAAFLKDPTILTEMGRRMHQLHVPNAAEHIAKIVLDAGRKSAQQKGEM